MVDEGRFTLCLNGARRRLFVEAPDRSIGRSANHEKLYLAAQAALNFRGDLATAKFRLESQLEPDSGIDAEDIEDGDTVVIFPNGEGWIEPPSGTAE